MTTARPPLTGPGSEHSIEQIRTISRTKSLNKLSQPRTAPNQGPENSTIQVPNRNKAINEPSPTSPTRTAEPTNQMLNRVKSVNHHTRPIPRESQGQPSAQTSDERQQTRMRSKTTSHAKSPSITTTIPPNFSHPHPTSTIPKHRYFTIKGRAQAFCSAFLNPSTNPPERILDDHFIPHDGRIIEYGPTFAQAKLPYTARPFRGKNEGLWYFRLQSETVQFLPDAETFSGSEGIVVDAEALNPGEVGRGVATVVGKARFRAVKTGQSWEARFVWRFSGFDEEGRIGLWEVWGDCLSAWVAVGSGGGTPF